VFQSVFLPFVYVKLAGFPVQAVVLIVFEAARIGLVMGGPGPV
jgi:hypothetical protein